MYAGLVKTAQALLAKFGTERTLTRTTQGAFDPMTGTYTSTTTDYKLNGVQVGITESWRGKFVIQEGDSIYLLEAGVVEPQAGDKIEGMSVVAVETVKPADVAVLYKVQVRG